MLLLGQPLTVSRPVGEYEYKISIEGSSLNIYMCSLPLKKFLNSNVSTHFMRRPVLV